MSRIKLTLMVIASILIGMVIGIVLTETLRERIFFSLFIGIPGGAASAIMSFSLLYYFLIRDQHTLS